MEKQTGSDPRVHLTWRCNIWRRLPAPLVKYSESSSFWRRLSRGPSETMTHNPGPRAEECQRILADGGTGPAEDALVRHLPVLVRAIQNRAELCGDRSRERHNRAGFQPSPLIRNSVNHGRDLFHRRLLSVLLELAKVAGGSWNCFTTSWQCSPPHQVFYLISAVTETPPSDQLIAKRGSFDQCSADARRMARDIPVRTSLTLD